MAEILFLCLAGGAVLLALFMLAAAFVCFQIADECDRHAKHIERINRQGGEGWE